MVLKKAPHPSLLGEGHRYSPTHTHHPDFLFFPQPDSIILPVDRDCVTVNLVMERFRQRDRPDHNRQPR